MLRHPLLQVHSWAGMSDESEVSRLPLRGQVCARWTFAYKGLSSHPTPKWLLSESDEESHTTSYSLIVFSESLSTIALRYRGHSGDCYGLNRSGHRWNSSNISSGGRRVVANG